MKKVLLFSGITLLVSGIAWYIYHQYQLLQQNCFNLTGHEVVKLGLNDTEINIDLEIKNKSAVDIVISSYDFDVFINDKPISKIKNKTSQLIKRNGVSKFTLSVSFNPKSVFKNLSISEILTGAFDKTQMKIRLKGVVSVETSGIRKKDQKVDIVKTLADMIPTGPKKEC